MPNTSRAAVLSAALSFGAIAASSSSVAAYELGPVTIYVNGGAATVINNSTNGYYVNDFDIGNASLAGAYVNAFTSQPDWQAVVSSYLGGYDYVTVADYLSLGSLADDIAPGARSSNFTYDTNQAINIYTVSLVNASGATEFYDGPGTPETSTWVMSLLGFAGLGFVGFRRAARRAGDCARRVDFGAERQPAVLVQTSSPNAT